ncbi:hypothetical protein HGA92_05680 [Candidatus Gracilibacteria bacterium]|nr:hypothetical protein [Candidatus Gracilibacteria bacterium]NUJ98640.1 hypothetical protein [Candidatus Gracilibacteria bacterium]
MEQEEITDQYNKLKEILSQDYDSIKKLKKDIWEVILNISQKVSSLVKGEDEISGAQAEDIGIQELKKLVNGNEDILEIEKMLDLFFQKIQDILEQKKKILPFSFFKSKKNPLSNGEKSENGTEKIFSTAPKYEAVLDVLSDLGIDLDKVKISEESLDEEKNGEGDNKPQVKKRRKVPYLSIEVKDKQKNLNIIILVCNELDQATFIYDGIFNLDELKNKEKEEKINGFNSYTIPYNEKNFYEKLKAKIEILSFKRFEEVQYKEELKSVGIGEEVIQEYSIEIGKFRYFFDNFLGQGEKKSGIAVENIDGKNILFVPFRGFSRDLILGGKRLASSPSEAFNQKYFNRNKHTTRDDVIQMLDFLGYKIADDDKMKQRWRKIIQENKKSFEEIGVYNKEGVWYFGNIHGSPEKLVIAGYYINYFRPKDFKDNTGKMITAVYDNNLKLFFESLGFQIASEEQEKANFVEILRREYSLGEQDFNNKGIFFHDEKWYIRGKNTKKNQNSQGENGDKRWLDLLVNGKSFKYFPSIGFNKTYCIQSSNLKTNGIMKSKNDLKIILEVLGEKVATEEEEKEFFSQKYKKVT